VESRTGVGGGELVEADGLRLREDLEGADEQGAVGGGGGAARRCLAAGDVAGDGEEAPEAAHPAGEAGESGRLSWAEKRADSESALTN
jgi:hypothetical protein